VVGLNRAYLVATICGAAPLVLGTAIFIAWLVTRRDWLTIAGFALLYCGLVVFAAGVIALARFCWVALRTPGIPRRAVWLSTFGCAALLLANFPVAGGIIWAANTIATRYTVVVHNASSQRLDGVRVFGGGCDASYGSIPPGGTARRSFWIRQGGVLDFRASSGNNALGGTIDDYLTRYGGHRTVTVQADQTISIAREAPNQLALVDRLRDVLFWRDRSPCDGGRPS
jgi:hypothetical protein